MTMLTLDTALLLRPAPLREPLHEENHMPIFSRRQFLSRSAAGVAAAGWLRGDPLGLPIGCQSYPVRKSINTDFAGTMKGLRAAGFTQIELCSPYGYGDFSSLQQYKPQELRRMFVDMHTEQARQQQRMAQAAHREKLGHALQDT